PAVAMLSVLNFSYLGLWAGPWLRDVAGFDGPARAQTLLYYTLGMLAGSLVLGQATSRAQARGLPALAVPAICMVALILAQAGLALGPRTPLAITALWLAFAFFGASGASGYIAVAQMFPPAQFGRVSTAINMLVLGGAFLLQSAIGWILDLWPRAAEGGWDRRGYAWSLALSIGLQCVVTAYILGRALLRRPARQA